MALKTEARVRQCLPNGAVKDQRLYSRWNAMRRRCYDPNFIVYKNYGRRGIRVCDAWRTDYLAFQKWALSHGWDSRLTLDRKDSDGDYSPENCRWVDRITQASNRGDFNLKVTIRGVTKCVCQWADEFGMSRSLVMARIRRFGWSPRKALTPPSAGRHAQSLTYGGETHTVYAWARKLSCSRSWIYQQLKAGRSLADIIERKTNGI